MPKRNCTVHYRKLNREDAGFPEITLYEALTRAMDHPISGVKMADNWQLRVAGVPSNSDHRRFLNDFHHDGEVFFGNLCLFSPNGLQALIEEDPGASVVDIAEETAPDGTEYLHGIAYWMAVRDHFFIVQHVSIQAKALEEYLTWLLRDQSDVIDNGHEVRLSSVFDRNQLGGDLGDISTIEVGGLVPETVRIDGGVAPLATPGEVVEYDAHEQLGDRVVKGYQRSREVLEAAIGSMATRQLIESVPDEAALEVNLSIGYRSRKRRIRREFMAGLEDSLRNMPDGEIRVKSKDAMVVGQDVRLQTVVPIDRVRENSNLLDNQRAREKLTEVYRRFLADGQISD